MITIERYVDNPIEPTFLGLITGKYRWSIPRKRIVTDMELLEIGYLQIFGIRPSLFKQEPDLERGAVIQAAMDKVSNAETTKGIYELTRAILLNKQEEKDARER